jgi:hypothetical protein
VAERQRRKAARESSDRASTPSSFVGDIARRASLLWSTRGQSRASIGAGIGLGKHTALRSQESLDVPLEDVNGASPTFPASPALSIDIQPENPFVTPVEVHSPSPETAEQPKAIMSPSSEPSPASDNKQVSRSTNAGTSKPRKPPPPKPLGLPPPRTPPPPIDIDEPPAAPEVKGSLAAEEGNENEVRWWHDWLCGCGEGPERGGDNQVNIIHCYFSLSERQIGRPNQSFRVTRN